MKLIAILLLTLWGNFSFAGNVTNTNKQGVILDGYDAVSYFASDTPKKGIPKYQVKQSEAIYWFSSEENKQAFLKEPQKYEPQFGGWCSYAVADSKSKVDIDPKSFVIQEGKLLLFYNGIWGDTRNKWLHSKDKDSKTFLKEADANWPEVKTKEP